MFKPIYSLNKMETKNNYYAEQLKKVDLTTGFPANVKITNCDTSTKTLSLNDESATALVKWLKENYNVTEG